MSTPGHPDDEGFVEPDVDEAGPCARCGRDGDDTVHDPFAPGSGATTAGHRHLPEPTDQMEAVAA